MWHVQHQLAPLHLQLIIIRSTHSSSQSLSSTLAVGPDTHSDGNGVDEQADEYGHGGLWWHYDGERCQESGKDVGDLKHDAEGGTVKKHIE